MGHLILFTANVFVIIGVSSASELYSDAQDLTVNLSKYKCFQEGRFSHPNSCGGYVECLRTGEGSFKRRFGSCHEGIFSEREGNCIQQEEDYDCKRSIRISREIKIDLRLRAMCNKIQNGFICGDCKTVVNCVAREAYPYTCGVGETCNERTEYGGAVCYPGQPKSCTCSEKQIFRADTYNPQMFFYCKAEGDEPEMYQCTEERKFDNKTNQCINAIGLPECSTMGEFAFRNNCTQYYTCIQGKNGWIQKNFTCDNGFMFNEITKTCEDPCSWKVEIFTCQKEGRFPDPMSCQRYYECIKQEHGFRHYHKQCPSGTEWNGNVQEGLGHCIKNVANTCKPTTVNICSYAKERCTVKKQINCTRPFVIVDEVGCIQHVKIGGRTAAAARSECSKLNADLYVADKPEELEILWQYFKVTSGANEYWKFWVGIEKRKWYGGRDVTQWGVGEPKANKDLCQYYGINGRIYEVDCTTLFEFICEKN